jgi:hypothetical protein
MFAYNPTVNNQAGSIVGAGMTSAAATRGQAMGNVGEDIGAAINSLGGTYAKYNEDKKKASAFDSVMGAAADEGLVTYDTLEKFRNLPWQQKAEAFNLYQNTIFPIQATTQKVEAQANAWGSRGYGGGGAGGTPKPDGSFTF